MSGPIPCSVPRANTAKGNAGTEENKQQKKARKRWPNLDAMAGQDKCKRGVPSDLNVQVRVRCEYQQRYKGHASGEPQEPVRKSKAGRIGRELLRGLLQRAVARLSGFFQKGVPLGGEP